MSIAWLVVAYVERVLDDAADQLRREEVGELRGEGRGEGVEVGALVILQASRRDHFLQVNGGCLCGTRVGARAEENRAQAMS